MPVVSRFPFSGGLISRLGRSDFQQAAVYIPFWNGVNTIIIPQGRGKRDVNVGCKNTSPSATADQNR